MGRITTPSPAPAATVLTHFSHPHELHPTPSLYNQPCAACNLTSTPSMYACLPCNFSLHQSCATLPRHITHPSHGGCTLALLTSPLYDAAAFRCDACKRPGHAWSYHCTRCKYDLHVACASKPMTTRHQAHASCDLQLTFRSPYTNADGFSCDICRKIGTNQWLYRCNSCEFDAHLDCIAGTPPPSQMPHAVLQHHNSLPLPPTIPSYQNPQMVHSASTGGISNIHGQNQGMPQMNPVNFGQGYNRPSAGPTMGSNLMMAAVQGLVEGAFQGVGQTVVQDVLGGGGGTEGGGDGADASTM